MKFCPDPKASSIQSIRYQSPETLRIKKSYFANRFIEHTHFIQILTTNFHSTVLLIYPSITLTIHLCILVKVSFIFCITISCIFIFFFSSYQQRKLYLYRNLHTQPIFFFLWFITTIITTFAYPSTHTIYMILLFFMILFFGKLIA